jgi:hypothetical protein
LAVLIEGISVVARVNVIKSKYPGGWERFRTDAPNKTLCSDNELARLGFMTPSDVTDHIKKLETIGFTYLDGENAIDLVVIDQMSGPLKPCSWVEYGKADMSGHQVAAARMVGSNVT